MLSIIRVFLCSLMVLFFSVEISPGQQNNSYEGLIEPSESVDVSSQVGLDPAEPQQASNHERKSEMRPVDRNAPDDGSQPHGPRRA